MEKHRFYDRFLIHRLDTRRDHREHPGSYYNHHAPRSRAAQPEGRMSECICVLARTDVT
jgi:hypothetical protein